MASQGRGLYKLKHPHPNLPQREKELKAYKARCQSTGFDFTIPVIMENIPEHILKLSAEDTACIWRNV